MKDVVAIERLLPASVAQSREKHRARGRRTELALEGNWAAFFLGDGEVAEMAEVRRILMLPTFPVRSSSQTERIQFNPFTEVRTTDYAGAVHVTGFGLFGSLGPGGGLRCLRFG